MDYKQINNNYPWLSAIHRAAIIGWYRQGVSFEDIYLLTDVSEVKIKQIVQEHLIQIKQQQCKHYN